MDVILASASPRRRDLLATLLAEFRVLASDVDETLGGPPAGDTIAALALAKARAVAGRLGQGIVLGADTVVIIDAIALGKPSGPEQARAMLRRLRGRTHDVVTGVAVVDASRGQDATAAVTTGVTMAEVPDAAIDAYVASGEPLDKAGAYAIQGEGAALVAGFVGSYSNVVGLPLAVTASLLRRFGVRLTCRADPDPSA